MLAASLCACQHLPPAPAPVPVAARFAGTVAEINGKVIGFMVQPAPAAPVLGAAAIGGRGGHPHIVSGRAAARLAGPWLGPAISAGA